MLAWRKGKVETSPFPILPSISLLSIYSRKATQITTTLFPPSKEARLTSLINEQVEIQGGNAIKKAVFP